MEYDEVVYHNRRFLLVIQEHFKVLLYWCTQKTDLDIANNRFWEHWYLAFDLTCTDSDAKFCDVSVHAY
jgi:hypothetical protein